MDVTLDEKQIFELIRQKHQKGFKKEATFSSLCYKLNCKPHPPAKTIEKWFNDVHLINQSEQKQKIKKCFLDLLKQVYLYYSLLDRAVHKNGRSCDKFTYLWANPRYRLDLMYIKYHKSDKVDKIEVYDDFHNQSLDFPIVNGSLPFLVQNYEKIIIKQITSNYFIAYQNFKVNQETKCLFQLMFIEFQKQACQIVKEVQLKINVDSIICDKSKPGKFVLLRHFKDAVIPSCQIYCGQLKNDEILVKSKIAAKIRTTNKDCYELSGTKFYGIRLESEYFGRRKAVYFEVELNGKSEEERIMFKFDFMFDIQPVKINKKSYSWSKDKCFMVATSPMEYYGFFSFILCFDTQTQQCSILKDFFFDTYYNTSDLCVDSNDVLCVHGKEAVYRLPLKRPESLQNLTWLETRRLSIFTNNNAYDNANKLLPYTSELRPFCF